MKEQLNEERAEVVAVHADHIELAARDVSSCGICAARAGCGHGLLDALGRGRRRNFALPLKAVPSDLAVGEEVLVGVPHGAIVSAAALIYGLPLTGLVAGAVLVPGGDGPALLAACLGFALGCLLARRLHGSHSGATLRCRRPGPIITSSRPRQAEPRARPVV